MSAHSVCIEEFGLHTSDKFKSYPPSSSILLACNFNGPTAPMYDEMGLHRQDITAHQRPQDPASTVPRGAALREPEWPWGRSLPLLDQPRPSPLNLEAGKGRESAEWEC